MTDPSGNGPRRKRNPNLSRFRPGPGGMVDAEQARAQRFRTDRMFGIALFIVGIVATISNMVASSENSLATQLIALHQQYGIGDYARTASLATISLVVTIAHLVNYAVWLLVALKRWEKRKLGAWCAFVGAVLALLISFVAILAALLTDPIFMTWVTTQTQLPTPTP